MPASTSSPSRLQEDGLYIHEHVSIINLFGTCLAAMVYEVSVTLNKRSDFTSCQISMYEQLLGAKDVAIGRNPRPDASNSVAGRISYISCISCCAIFSLLLFDYFISNRWMSLESWCYNRPRATEDEAESLQLKYLALSWVWLTASNQIGLLLSRTAELKNQVPG